MAKSSATILARASRPAGRGAGTGLRKRTIMAAMALSLLTSSLAMADPHWDGGHDRGDHQERRHDDGDHRGDGDHRDWRRDEGEHRGWHRGDDDRRDWHRDDHDRGDHRDDRWRDHRDDRYRERFDSGRYWHPLGYYVHEWRRGERLPIAYRAPMYVIPNIAVYHLRPPPPGYCWVRVDNNAVLTAIATGVVVDVAFHLFH